MVEDRPISLWRQPWFIRKVVYTIFSIISVILAGKGALDANAETALFDLVEPIVSLVSGLVFALAGIKTDSSSDDRGTVTFNEVDASVSQVYERVANDTSELKTTVEKTNNLLDELRSRLNS